MGRKLLRMDVLETVRAQDRGFLHDNLPDVFYDGEPMRTFFKAADTLKEYLTENGDWMEYFALAEQVLRTAGYKAYLHAHLRTAYQAQDLEELRKILDEILPLCRESYQRMYRLFWQQWHREYKAFGWEVHCQRVGFQIARIDYAAELLDQYLKKEISCIEELDVKQLYQNIYLG